MLVESLPSRVPGSDDRVELSVLKDWTTRGASACAARAKPSFEIPVLRSLFQRDSLALKSVKRSVINIQRSMLDVRCSTFNLFMAEVQTRVMTACARPKALRACKRPVSAFLQSEFRGS